MSGRGPERITIDSIPSGADVAIDCPSGPKSTGVTPAKYDHDPRKISVALEPEGEPAPPARR